MLLDRPWSPPKLGAKLYLQLQQHHDLRSSKMAELVNSSKVLRTHNPCYAWWYQHSDWMWDPQYSIRFDMKRKAMRVNPFLCSSGVRNVKYLRFFPHPVHRKKRASLFCECKGHHLNVFPLFPHSCCGAPLLSSGQVFLFYPKSGFMKRRWNSSPFSPDMHRFFRLWGIKSSQMYCSEKSDALML